MLIILIMFNLKKMTSIAKPLAMIAVVVLVTLLVLHLLKTRTNRLEKFYGITSNDDSKVVLETPPVSTNVVTQNAPKGLDVSEIESELLVNDKAQNLVDAPVTRTSVKPTELLPNVDAASTWNDANPVEDDGMDRNYLDAGFHVGINSVGQSLRNANLQIRSEPANPQDNVSPFLNSTISPDLERRPLEICSEEATAFSVLGNSDASPFESLN